MLRNGKSNQRCTVAALGHKTSRTYSQRMYMEQPRLVLSFRCVREWLYVSEKRVAERRSFCLSFKERWPLEDGNSSLSSRTWDRVKSFPLSNLSLSLSFTFSLLSAFISFVVSIFVLYSQVNGTNERHSATLTRFDHPPKLFSYERFVNRSNSLIPIGCLNHVNDIE